MPIKLKLHTYTMYYIATGPAVWHGKAKGPSCLTAHNKTREHSIWNRTGSLSSYYNSVYTTGRFIKLVRAIGLLGAFLSIPYWQQHISGQAASYVCIIMIPSTVYGLCCWQPDQPLYQQKPVAHFTPEMLS